MADFVLLKHPRQGYALYQERKLCGTWDRREPLPHIEGQIAKRAGSAEAEYTERDHKGGDWPAELAKPGPKPKAPAGDGGETP